MGKLLGLFGRSENEADQTDEAPASEETAPAAEAPAAVAETDQFATAALPLGVQTNPYATIDDYAASLPAPDYVDPAGKASARSEAA